MKTRQITIEVPDGYDLKETEKGIYKLEKIDQEKKWQDFGDIFGYYVDNDARIRQYQSNSNQKYTKNIFPSQEEAHLYGLVLPQLLQWRDKVNGEWKADWKNSDDLKWCIYCVNGIIDIYQVSNTFYPLHFKTEQIAEQFMKDHKSLIEQIIIL